MSEKDGLPTKVHAHAQLLIDCGFYGLDDYKKAMIHRFYSSPNAAPNQNVDVALGNLYSQRLAEQAAWEETPGAVFNELFEELTLQDIAAFQFLGSKLTEANRYAAESAEDAWGYCYFTRKDALHLVTNGKIAVTFGRTKGEEDGPSITEIGQDIMDTLDGFGFKVARLTPISKRISVWTPSWRRKLDPSSTWPLLGG